MTFLRQYIQTLKPSVQQLACLYAYIGGDLKDEDKTQLAVHGVCMMGELQIMTGTLLDSTIIVHQPATHFGPEQQFIRPKYYAEVMLFAMEEHPEWLKDFDSWPLTRYTSMNNLQKAVRMCAAGKMPPPMLLEADIPPYLMGFAHDRRFEPLITMIRDVDFPAFISACIKKWIKEDFSDPDDVLKHQLSMRKFDTSDPDIKALHALAGYYRYVCQGQYTPPASIRMTFYDLLLKGVHAMSQGKADLAVKVFGEAITATSKNGSNKAEKFLTDGVAALFWVVATWTSNTSDNKQRLQTFCVQAREGNYRRVGTALLLAEMLVHPLQRINMDLLTELINPQSLADKEFVFQQQMATLLAAHFTGYQISADTFQPQSAFLRHEAAGLIKMTKYEKKLLDGVFGNKPLSSFIRAKAPWELMLDRLIATESHRQAPSDEGEHRVMYIILNDGESVELREQNRLRSGKWGLGKGLPWSRFMSGSESFMDRADQAVVADLRYLQATRVTVGAILPHLVGSDRVYTGEQTPFRRVNIEAQRPYVIVERTADGGFHLQSNVQFQDMLSQTNVYHREDSMHYIFFPMSDRERSVLQELLSVTDFPPEAESQLRKLLPLIRNVTDIHSDLIEDERELETITGQTPILIRLTPDPTAQTMFDAYVLVRPLLGGKMALTPGQGDKVIIDECDNGRFRVERDMEGETCNLDTLLAYTREHKIDFNENLNGHLGTAQVLDLLAFVSCHQDICAVEWPEGEKLRMHSTTNADWNISLTNRGRWFEIEGEVKLTDNAVLSAQQLLQAIGNSHGGYVQLQNGDYLWLSERIRRQLDALESISTTENNRPAISTLQTGLLADILHGDIEIKHDGELGNLKQRIEQADDWQPTVPEQLTATLRPYQTEGFQWLMRLASWGAGACLADDMGLGKTVQTIAFLLAHADEGPSLVVAPASVVSNWQAELGRFAPTLTSYNLSDYYDRKPVVKQASARDVVVCTYGLIVSQAELLCSRKWNIICLDEAHNIKNRGTKTSAACMNLTANYRLILTGTPVQNHLGELWNLFQFINPGLLGTYEQFNAKYILPIENSDDKERHQQLQAVVAPFMLRRTKASVVQELPDKTEITLNVELTEDEMATYEVIRREAEQRFREEGEQLSVNALAEITRLRRTACSVALTNSEWTGGSSKVNAFMELVSDIVEGGHSVLVFSQFTSFLKIIGEALTNAHLPYLYLDGNLTIRQREQLVTDFQKGKRPIFLISLKAGGVGLNLTAANYVIHLDPWWNPAIEQQATDRAYRIGQTKAVTVYHLISHHTIEEKILRLHESKRALSDSILETAEQSHRLTAQELLEMLSNNW